MKYIRIRFGLLCFCIAIAGFVTSIDPTSAEAQQAQNVLDQNAHVNFSEVRVGSTECQPLIASNTTDQPLTISHINFSVGSEFFTLSDTTSLPKILEAGQSVILGNVCFTSKAANKEYVGYINITFNPHTHSDDGEIRIDAITETDSSLLSHCFTVAFDSTTFGPVFYGAKSYRTMNVTNNKDTLKTIRCIDFTIGDANVFSGEGKQFPLEVPPHQTRQIHLVFSPLAPHLDGTNNFRSNVKIESMDATDGCSPDFDIYGTAIKSTDMNTLNAFDRHAILPTLKMTGTTEIFGRMFLFQNTDSVNLRVMTILLDSTYAHFTLEPMGVCTGLPMTAIPGEIMEVRISLDASDSGAMYTNKLRFVLGNGMAPLVYPVEAMRIADQSGVHPSNLPDSPFTFSAIPNPSSGSITIEISGSNKADIDIFSTDGKHITSEKSLTSWTWNGKNSAGINVPSGNYLIRAITHDANGKEITKTKQVAIVR